MKQGDRVVILRARTARGAQGTVIWYGDDRFDEEGLRKRVGIRIEGQAEPVYVNAAHVELLEAASGALLADPEDRSRYAVYGDWLQERGDPL
jgi:uncharacterized protein (TIGR02996 family)